MRIEPVFLFDLDGTLVDSVYQHVLAWKEALDTEGIDLSVWRIHRKIGMTADCSPTNSSVKPAFRSTKSAASGCGCPRGGLPAHRASDPPSSRRAGTADWLTARASAGRSRPAGDGDGPVEPRGPGRRSGQIAGSDPRSSQIRQARSGPVLAAAERLGAPIETAFVVGDSSGTCWRQRAAGRSASACSAAATARGTQRPPPSGSMRTRPTSCCTSTNWAGGGRPPEASSSAGGCTNISGLRCHFRARISMISMACAPFMVHWSIFHSIFHSGVRSPQMWAITPIGHV